MSFNHIILVIWCPSLSARSLSRDVIAIHTSVVNF